MMEQRERESPPAAASSSEQELRVVCNGGEAPYGVYGGVNALQFVQSLQEGWSGESVW